MARKQQFPHRPRKHPKLLLSSRSNWAMETQTVIAESSWIVREMRVLKECVRDHSFQSTNMFLSFYGLDSFQSTADRAAHIALAQKCFFSGLRIRSQYIVCPPSLPALATKHVLGLINHWDRKLIYSGQLSLSLSDKNQHFPNKSTMIFSRHVHYDELVCFVLLSHDAFACPFWFIDIRVFLAQILHSQHWSNAVFASKFRLLQHTRMVAPGCSEEILAWSGLASAGAYCYAKPCFCTTIVSKSVLLKTES